MCGALGSDEEISGVVRAVSFDDTLGEIGMVAEEGLSEGQMIPVGTVEIYEVIAGFGEKIGSEETVGVNTKYKIVDRKVRLVTSPLPEGSEERMKGVASDPSLRNPNSAILEMLASVITWFGRHGFRLSLVLLELVYQVDRVGDRDF